jgi:hypothetical protein
MNGHVYIRLTHSRLTVLESPLAFLVGQPFATNINVQKFLPPHFFKKNMKYVVSTNRLTKHSKQHIF